MSTTILTSLSTYMSKTSSMTTSKLKFVILKRLNKWKIKKKFRGGSCPGGKCTKVGGGRCHKNRGGRCHKNGGGKCPGGKCNTIVAFSIIVLSLSYLVFCSTPRWVLIGRRPWFPAAWDSAALTNFCPKRSGRTHLSTYTNLLESAHKPTKTITTHVHKHPRRGTARLKTAPGKR